MKNIEHNIYGKIDWHLFWDVSAPLDDAGKNFHDKRQMKKWRLIRQASKIIHQENSPKILQRYVLLILSKAWH